MHIARDLVVRQPTLGERAQRRGIEGLRTRLHLDPGADLLAVPRVRDTDHLGVLDAGVRVEELLDLTRVDVLATTDHHVLDPADDGAVTVLAHHRQVTGVHPAIVVDRLGGLVGIVPVPEHHRVATGAELAGVSALDDFAGVRVDDLHLDMGMRPADGGGAALQIVIVQRLTRHRRGLGHAVGDGHLGHVHLVDTTLHHLDRAHRAGHDPGAQARQVAVGEARVVLHGDEHGRYAVYARTSFGLNGFQGQPGIEPGRRDDHGDAMGGAAEIAHHHAEAMVERHRYAEPIAGGEVDALGDEEAVVQDVAVRQRRPLRETRCTRGVLDVDRIGVGQRRLTFGQPACGYGVGAQGLPVVGAQEDHLAQRGCLLAHLGDHPDVVAGLELGCRDQHPHLRLVEHIGQFVCPVGGVDVDQDGADLGGRVLDDGPLGSVRRPDPHAVTLGDTPADQAPRDDVDLIVEFAVGPPLSLRQVDKCLDIGVCGDRACEVGADGLFDERGCGGPRVIAFHLVHRIISRRFARPRLFPVASLAHVYFPSPKRSS